ncbi:skin secretory protein xP2-like [Vidua chalybeata]|uniref:skin secretory protein xP2-like n=1 Tax=Vidua chalybeata TaxID=81927 RepID=UPI0023A8F060|nr:skin secretory protein xP2-like [Vidua chalybeata]
MANPGWFPSVPPQTPQPYQGCSRCPPGLSCSTSCNCPPRLTAPGRPRSPAGGQGRGERWPRAGATSPGGEEPGALSQRGHGAGRAVAERRGAARPRQSPAPTPPPAHLPRPAQETPGPAVAGGDAAAPRAAPGEPGAAGLPQAAPLEGERPSGPVAAELRPQHTPGAGTAEGGGTRGCGGLSHLFCRARGARLQLTCSGLGARSNAHGLSR